MPQDDYRVLGCDPGRINFAWAIYGDDGLEDHGLIEGAEEVKRLDYNAAHFEKIIRFHSPDACCIERFHQRPGKGAVKNMELVNLMIGQARMICRLYKIPCKLITASDHKKWTAHHFDVERVKTKASKNGVGKKFDISTYKEWRGLPTDHEVDAANVAKYAHDHAMIEHREEEHE